MYQAPVWIISYCALLGLVAGCGAAAPAPTYEEVVQDLSANFGCNSSQVFKNEDGSWSICGLQADRRCHRQTGNIYFKPEEFLSLQCSLETSYPQRDHNLLYTARQRFEAEQTCAQSEAVIAYIDALVSSYDPPKRFWVDVRGCGQAAIYACDGGAGGKHLPPKCARESFQNENKIRAFEASAAHLSTTTACPLDQITTSSEGKPIDDGGFPFYKIPYDERTKTFSLTLWACAQPEPHPYTCPRIDPLTEAGSCAPTPLATSLDVLVKTHRNILKQHAQTLLDCAPDQASAGRLTTDFQGDRLTTRERIQGCGRTRDLSCSFPSITSDQPNCTLITLKDHAPARDQLREQFKIHTSCTTPKSVSWERLEPDAERFVVGGCDQSLDYLCTSNYRNDTITCKPDYPKQRYDEAISRWVFDDFVQRNRCPAREVRVSNTWLTDSLLRYSALGCGDSLYWLCPPPSDLAPDATLTSLCEATKLTNTPRRPLRPGPPM